MTQPDESRLITLIRYLEQDALNGSAALPAGRGGKSRTSRDDHIRYAADEARKLAGLAEAQRPGAPGADRIRFIKTRRDIATDNMVKALRSLRRRLDDVDAELERLGPDARLESLDYLAKDSALAARYSAEREGYVLSLIELAGEPPRQKETPNA